MASHAGETTPRLRQLDWLCRKISEHEAKSVEFLNWIVSQATASKPDMQERWAAEDASQENTFEMEILVESFYYVAFRLWKVIQGLPDLSNFRCDGVRDVRNHLLAHPERGDSGILYGVR